MPWYKIDFKTGIINQSHIVEYEFSPIVLTDEEEQDLFDQYTWMHDDAVGTVSSVTTLSREAKQALITKYIDEQAHAGEMLAVLNDTPIEKTT